MCQGVWAVLWRAIDGVAVWVTGRAIKHKSIVVLCAAQVGWELNQQVVRRGLAWVWLLCSTQCVSLELKGTAGD
jgi:hypothetical protein